MNESTDPVSKKDLDVAITMVMAHNADQTRQFLDGLVTSAIVLIIAFLLGDVWGVLVVLVVMRIIQFFHPQKKALEAVKKQYLSYWDR